MVVPWGLIETLGPSWGWLVFSAWLAWQLYCPLPNYRTKLQQFHHDLTTRLERIEITQVALSEEVADVDEGTVREIHGQDNLSVSDLKRN